MIDPDPLGPALRACGASSSGYAGGARGSGSIMERLPESSFGIATYLRPGADEARRPVRGAAWDQGVEIGSMRIRLEIATL